MLERFRHANLKLISKKCKVVKSEVTCLGYKIKEHGILPDPNNVAKVLEWPIPSNITEVRQFLG